MMCYKDMTFCTFGQCAKRGECPTFLTEEMKKDAEQYPWGICTFVDKPDCFEEEDVIPEHGC